MKRNLFILIGLLSFTQMSFAQEETPAPQQVPASQEAPSQESPSQEAPATLKDNVIAWTESAIRIINETGDYERNLIGGLDSFFGQAVAANDPIQSIIGDSENKLVDISPIKDHKTQALPVLEELLANLKK